MVETPDESAHAVPPRARIFAAARGGWYSLLAASFLICSFNPIAAVALATGAITPHEVYTTPRGWTLTGASFLFGALGLACAEWLAWRDRNRRALEISSILTCGASLLAFSVGRAVMAYLMYPIGVLFVAIGAIGLWTTRTVPDITEMPGVSAPPPARPRGQSAAPPPAPGPRRRKRRRRHKRRNPSAPGGGIR